MHVLVCTILPGRGRAKVQCAAGAGQNGSTGPVVQFNCKFPTSLVLRLLKEARVCVDLRSLLDQPPSTARQLHLLVGHP